MGVCDGWNEDRSRSGEGDASVVGEVAGGAGVTGPGSKSGFFTTENTEGTERGGKRFAEKGVEELAVGARERAVVWGHAGLLEEGDVAAHGGDGFSEGCEWMVEVVADQASGQAEGSPAGVDDDSRDGADVCVDEDGALLRVFGGE